MLPDLPYRSPHTICTSDLGFGGQVPPTQKSRFDHVTSSLFSEFFLKIFMARGYEDLRIKGLSRKSDDGNNVKWGLKCKVGVAFF